MAYWTNEDDLLGSIAACLKKASAGELLQDAPFWEKHAQDALAWSYARLRRLLAGGGYCPWQLDAWDGSAEHAEVALLKALELGGVLEQVEPDLLQRLRGGVDEIMKGFVLYDATTGDRIVPLCGGRVGYGEIDSESVFRRPRQPRPPESLGWPKWREYFPPW